MAKRVRTQLKDFHISEKEWKAPVHFKVPIICGGDPGKNGGVTLIAGDTVETYPMPDSRLDILTLMRALAVRGCKAFVIEKVHSMPGDGGRQAFTFGAMCERLAMATLAAGMALNEVQPQKWQAEFVPPSRSTDAVKQLREQMKSLHGDELKQAKKNLTSAMGRARREHKNALKARAQELFPHLNITLKTADSVLIAEYGRRHYL